MNIIVENFDFFSPTIRRKKNVHIIAQGFLFWRLLKNITKKKVTYTNLQLIIQNFLIYVL